MIAKNGQLFLATPVNSERDMKKPSVLKGNPFTKSSLVLHARRVHVFFFPVALLVDCNCFMT